VFVLAWMDLGLLNTAGTSAAIAAIVSGAALGLAVVLERFVPRVRKLKCRWSWVFKYSDLLIKGALCFAVLGSILSWWADSRRQDYIGQLNNGPTTDALAPLRPLDSRLIEAVVRGDDTGAERLIAQGADPNSKDAFGQSPLHYAVAGQRAAVVASLLANGARVNIRNQWNDTPLDMARAKKLERIGPMLEEALVREQK
jgi:hypothetical protein